MVNFVTAVAYHVCLALPAAFTQPGARLLAEPCTVSSCRWAVPELWCMTETDLTLLELEREFVGEMGRIEDDGSDELRLWSESNLEKGLVGSWYK